ncbi:hypothetical protein KIN20_002524 [Parelaphostrongylus tenuis]|uniref:Uncharacterized protein n=1 Tax=Parelaphostrongylus tenuis TaxID=148309 RepID=A0AAD5MGS1_PARTN|nr:hypothetical protein KIN20_002524 [Parelaphostrongylus tenuis]
MGGVRMGEKHRFIALVHVVLVTPILFDLSNGLGPRYPQCICVPSPCAAAASASATSISGATVVKPIPPRRPTYIEEVQLIKPPLYSRGYAPPPAPSPPPSQPYLSRYPCRLRIRRSQSGQHPSGLA